MIKINKMKKEFNRHGGVLKTSELNNLGFSSRQIKTLAEEGAISRIKHGFYEENVPLAVEIGVAVPSPVMA